MPDQWNERFDVIVIGSGFGGAVAITELANREPKLRILVLERGTWWRNPEGPGLRKYKKTAPLRIHGKWQYWGRPNDSQGLAYVADSIYKEHNPILDAVNPFFRDNDLGVKKNRKGMYRLTRFSHRNGNVDVVSGSAVGGGSLFYSGVNLIPHRPILERIGLDYLTSADFRAAGRWMKKFRGKINKINTKVPVPHYMPETPTGAHFQLSRIPESGDSSTVVDYEMPNPDLEQKKAVDRDFLLLDRARVLKRAMTRVVKGGGFGDIALPGKAWTSDPAAFEHEGFEPIPLSIVEYDKDNAHPIETDDDSDSTDKNTFCSRDGRCILGCLPSARHTLYKTIQKRQEKGGDITVLPMTKVSHLGKEGGDFVVHFESHVDGAAGEATRAVAPKVFLGAGCLGTTEIMLRTQQMFAEGKGGLNLSPMVGRHFSTNGDFFGFTWNMDRDYKTRRSVNDDERIGNANPTDGPINSSHFYVTFGEDENRRIDVNVEDAGIPSTFARLVHALLPKFSDFRQFMSLAKGLVRILLNRDPFPSNEDPDTESREQADYLTERELLSSVFFYNLMGSGPDEPFGTFSLQRDGSGLDLSYDDHRKLADWDVFKQQEVILGQLTKHMEDPGDDERKPELMLSPFWQNDKRVTVVHPLGGCPIGADRTTGAIDRDGRVYDGDAASDTGVHQGLYVVDGAAVPGALAVNPTYTIVTHAVRCVKKAAGPN